MAPDALRVVIPYTGLAGVALLAVFGLFRGGLSNILSSKLAKAQIYRLLMVILLGGIVVTLASCFVYVRTCIPPVTPEPSTPPTAVVEPPPATQKPPPTVAVVELPSATREPSPSPTAVRKDFEREMVLVPEGEFDMGTEDEIVWLLGIPVLRCSLEDEGPCGEHPQHTVYLDAFYIDKYEVTNEQFAQFIDATGYSTDAEKEGWGFTDRGGGIVGANWRHPGGPGTNIADKMDHPVVFVSWHDAAAYCRWLSEATGQVFRLPTEAEWEKAARGEDARQWPWGDKFDPQKANTQESGPGTTTPVGQYSPAGDSPYGASDMTGNVWEWCQDWYAEDYYRRSPSENPSGRGAPGPTEVGSRVRRGGSWGSYAQRFARCAYRRWSHPASRSSDVGFRVVVSPGSP